MKPEFIAILGLGLIGGSLGLAFRSGGPQNLKVLGWDASEQVRQEALSRGAITDIMIDWQELGKADLIVLCTPMQTILPLAEKVRPYIKTGAVLTDAGSVKNCLCQTLNQQTNRFYYIGGHPMAGREKSGIQAAQANLFRDKCYILTPDTATPPEALQVLERAVGWTGAKLTFMSPEQHDECAATISHLPHIAAAALVNTLQYYDQSENFIKLAGGGFRDTTRIASSNATMWTDICLTNKQEILTSLKKYQAVLDEITAAVEQEDEAVIHQYFTTAKMRRDGLLDSYDRKRSI